MSAARPVALVTGGAIRLGEAISRALAAEGYCVAIHAHGHLERAAVLAAELDGVALGADLSDRGQIDGLFAALDASCGRLDVLVNNAAIFRASDQDVLPTDEWDAHVAMNLTAPFRCCQLAVPRIRAVGGGSIVNLVDIAAARPYRRLAHYGATKAGLIALTRGLAVDWAPTIRVNAVAPGAALMPEWYADEDRERRVRRIPMGREIGAEDVARTVVFLACGPSGITGEVIRVDGGRAAAW